MTRSLGTGLALAACLAGCRCGTDPVGATASQATAPQPTETKTPSRRPGRAAPYRSATGKTKSVAPAIKRLRELEQQFRGGVHKINDTTYRLDRSRVGPYLEAQFGQPPARPPSAEPLRASRPRVNEKNTNGEGVRVWGLQPHAPFVALGLQNDDVIRRVNGQAVTPASLRAVYSQLASATRITVELLRNGRKLTLTYLIR